MGAKDLFMRKLLSVITLLLFFNPNTVAAQEGAARPSSNSLTQTIGGVTLVFDSTIGDRSDWAALLSADSTFPGYFARMSNTGQVRVYISSIKQVGARRYEFRVSEIPLSTSGESAGLSVGYSIYLVTTCMRIGKEPARVCRVQYLYSEI